MRSLQRSLYLDCVVLYSVITSTNLRDSVECCGIKVEAAHQDVNTCADSRRLEIIILWAKCDHREIGPCFLLQFEILLRTFCFWTADGTKEGVWQSCSVGGQRSQEVCLSLSTLDTLKVRFVTVLLNIASMKALKVLNIPWALPMTLFPSERRNACIFIYRPIHVYVELDGHKTKD